MASGKTFGIKAEELKKLSEEGKVVRDEFDQKLEDARDMAFDEITDYICSDGFKANVERSAQRGFDSTRIGRTWKYDQREEGVNTFNGIVLNVIAKKTDLLKRLTEFVGEPYSIFIVNTSRRANRNPRTPGPKPASQYALILSWKERAPAPEPTPQPEEAVPEAEDESDE